MGLDRILFPAYRKQPIDRPVFIVGNPRSGTTFLHRLLLGSGDDLAAFELWEMLFPAITARKLLGRSSRGSTVSHRPATTPRISTTRICAASRPTTCCGSSGPWTARCVGIFPCLAGQVGQ